MQQKQNKWTKKKIKNENECLEYVQISPSKNTYKNKTSEIADDKFT